MSTDTSCPSERTGPVRASFAGHLILVCFIALMLGRTLHETVLSTTPTNTGATPMRLSEEHEPPDATTAERGAADRHARSHARKPAPKSAVRQPA